MKSWVLPRSLFFGATWNFSNSYFKRIDVIFNSLAFTTAVFLFFLVGHVEERPWWPIQSPNIGRKKKAVLESAFKIHLATSNVKEILILHL